jgi:hypothetical protein
MLNSPTATSEFRKHMPDTYINKIEPHPLT